MLFQAGNEGVCNILGASFDIPITIYSSTFSPHSFPLDDLMSLTNTAEHYFEMSKVDATEALDIYKSFIAQTDRVVDYLGMARRLHNIVNIPVPNLKHAPTGLVKALAEYLNDPNFEENRLEYKSSLGVVEGKAGESCPSFFFVADEFS